MFLLHHFKSVQIPRHLSRDDVEDLAHGAAPARLIEVDAVDDPSARRKPQIARNVRLWWCEILFLILTPVVATLAFKISTVNHPILGVDPWLYTGLARDLEDSWLQYQPSYYAVRFSAVLPMRWSYHLFGDIGGYLVLHYLACLLLIGSLYSMVRAYYGPMVAAAVVVFLASNPLAAGFIAWDYVSFLAIPYFMASIALWTLGAGKSFLWRVAAGFFAAAAIVAHLYLGIGLAIFYASEVLVAIWTGKAATLRVALGAAYAGMGFALCLVSGWLAYAAILGWISPVDLISPTLAAAASVPSVAHQYSRPYYEWAASLYHVYIPIILAVAAFITMLKRFDTFKAWAPLCFSIVYVGIVFFYRILTTTFVVEQMIYFSYLTPAIYLMLAITLAGLSLRTISLWLFALISVGIALLWAWLPEQAITSFYSMFRGSFVALGVMATLSIITCALLLRSRGSLVSPIVAVLLAIILQVATFVSPNYSEFYGFQGNSIQWPRYIIGTEIVDIRLRHSRPDQRMFIWTPNLPSEEAFYVSFVCFEFRLNDAWVGPGMPTIGADEVKRLSDKRYNQILILSQQPNLIDEGVASLTKAGFQVEAGERITLGYDPLLVYAKLVKIVSRNNMLD